LSKEFPIQTESIRWQILLKQLSAGASVRK